MKLGSILDFCFRTNQLSGIRRMRTQQEANKGLASRQSALPWRRLVRASIVCLDFSFAETRHSAPGQVAPLAVNRETSRTDRATAVVRFKIPEGGTLRHCNLLSAILLEICTPAGGWRTTRRTTMRTTHGLLLAFAIPLLVTRGFVGGLDDLVFGSQNSFVI